MMGTVKEHIMNHEVGKTVYVKTRYSILPGTVVKVTPKGSTDVKFASSGSIKRFSPEGEMVPADRWAQHYLLTDEKAAAELAYEQEKATLIKAANAISAVTTERGVNYQWGLDGLQKEVERLQGLLDAAKTLVAEVK